MLNELSEKLGIQFIIVTHDMELKEYATTAYKILKRGKKSIVRKVV